MTPRGGRWVNSILKYRAKAKANRSVADAVDDSPVEPVEPVADPVAQLTVPTDAAAANDRDAAKRHVA